MKLKGKCYLVLEQGRYGNDLRIVAKSSKRPKLGASQLAVRIAVEISSEAFDDLLPKATIVIPDECIIPPEVLVEATTEAADA